MQAHEITRALKGTWHGHYGTACCPAHGDRSPSLSLRDGEDGRLLLHCHAGCAFIEVLEALRSRGLVEGGGSCKSPDPASLARQRQAEASEAAKRAAQARRCWEETLPIEGTPAEAYLRHRGIACALPATLRFHPDCWHPTAKRLPALVALVEGVDSAAIHRTYLQADGGRKAAVEPAKAMLGPCAGGAVRLVEAPETPAAPLVVTEGIETALSLASGLLNGPASIWAALSTSGMRALRMPAAPGELIVASDGDEAGQAAAYSLATRAHSLGWTVSLLPAPDDADWNDVLQAHPKQEDAA